MNNCQRGIPVADNVSKKKESRKIRKKIKKNAQPWRATVLGVNKNEMN